MLIEDGPEDSMSVQIVFRRWIDSDPHWGRPLKDVLKRKDLQSFELRLFYGPWRLHCGSLALYRSVSGLVYRR